MILKPVIDAYRETEEFRELYEKYALNNEKTAVEGIAPSSFPILTASLFQANPKQYLVVTENSQKMQETFTDLSCLVSDDALFMIPPWETLPYEFVSPSEKVERNRITAIYRLMKGAPAIFITTIESILRKLPDKSFFINKGITLDKDEEYPFDDIIEMLVSYGYSREFRVDAFGQFTVKGGILDIFLPSYDNPVRLDFFGDTLDSIREFDVDTQKSLDSMESITIYPRKELILFDKEKEKLTDILQKAYDEGSDFPEEITSALEDGALSEVHGIEDLFPLVTEGNTLLSYLSEDSRIILLNNNDLVTQKNLLSKSFHDLYNKKSKETLCLPPIELFEDSVYDDAAERALSLQVFTTKQDALNFNLSSIQNFHGKIKMVREMIEGRLDDSWRIIITTGFEGQARRLFDLLSEFSIDSDFDNIDPDAPVSIIISPFREGIEIAASKTIVISDHEIFGKRYRKKRQFKKKSSRPIESFLDLKPGDYVVHINHGIGIFNKIERMNAGGVERDFFMIDFAGDDKLYVPLDQITMIQKYIGMDGRQPRVDHLGKQSAWNKIKQKVQESVEETAKELLKIYSARETRKGYHFPPDTMWQEEFETLFEFEETPDQITAIEDVKDDMESTKPMDRLICGDVGFGKTEVAIRAAFKSVMAGKQVAILVPTTVLAMQHFTTFKKRFSGYPIEIEMMSRFRSTGEVKKIKEQLKEGAVDIVIGTHALLAKDMGFKGLGLLIIDEEQRFGVRHKEGLKKMRALVDVMTLSATPIPRTLHMALAGIRDLSIIATPPENRQSIETYVLEENPDILRNAILKEIERNGQVFFVHNRVQSIEAQAQALEKLVPEASCCIAHGQMNEHQLEEVMIEFINGSYDVLISTTIIESGLDMPNVNTIIINRADTFGLSQLYQLRGRVGRSISRAYAYLFYPKHIPLNEDAQKRLQVISEYSDLGSGFKIAMKDLEIRGAGNMLGKEQSGNIIEVGFELYSQMLDDAVKHLKGEEIESDFRTPVFINTDFYIPNDYINDERQIIEFYKKFESCSSEEEVEILEKELIDRFGPVPEKVSILIEYEKIRAMASILQIDEILEDSKSIRIRISGQSRIDIAGLVTMISKDSRLTIDRNDQELLIMEPKENETKKKLEELKKWLQQLL